MIRQRKPIRKRETPRRERPELFFQPAPEEPWRKISLRVRHKWWEEKGQHGNLVCGICGKPILYWFQLVPDHIAPGKLGGCKDHSESNLQPAHKICNAIKGSRRNFKYEQAVSS